MWWPAIGGLVIGIGGSSFPQALGVGYDVIAALLHGDVVRNVVIGILRGEVDDLGSLRSARAPPAACSRRC